VSETGEGRREGSLDAPIRHPLKWKTDPEFYEEGSLMKELERVYDICHGCRRCFSLCHAFPTLFDAIDESETMELDGVERKVYWDVVDHCYLCDLCFQTKCPYVPPHEFNVDFPKLMLRAKAVKHRNHGASFRDRVLSSTDTVGSLAGIPIVVNAVNAANRNRTARRMLHRTFGVHADAPVPEYHSRTLRKRERGRASPVREARAAGRTSGRVALFTTCYGNYNAPGIGEDLIAVFEHNGIEVVLPEKERCCGMPKLELGDLESVEKAKDVNVPELLRLVDAGYDIVAPIPSCMLMFKQELPLLFDGDKQVARLRDSCFDPFEYLMLRHREGLLNTTFSTSLGKVAYHPPCHQRVQNIGPKTREVLALVPDTSFEVIERCSGHDGTYAVKAEFHEISMKIGRPVSERVRKSGADHYSSDCPMAGEQIANGVGDGSRAIHPISLLRKAYGI